MEEKELALRQRRGRGDREKRGSEERWREMGGERERGKWRE